MSAEEVKVRKRITLLGTTSSSGKVYFAEELLYKLEDMDALVKALLKVDKEGGIIVVEKFSPGKVKDDQGEIAGGKYDEETFEEMVKQGVYEVLGVG